MVDLQAQYLRMKSEIDTAIEDVLIKGDFIQGELVKIFESELARYTGSGHVISCANGTDALQIAMMALRFKKGDEVILPVHTYVATAEVIAVLGLSPIFVDVDKTTFTIDIDQVRKAITPKTVAIVPVHLYGLCADMESLLSLARRYDLKIIEDAAQALGSVYHFSDGINMAAGTMGIIGATSFFPSKNLGAYGDGGALFCSDDSLATLLRMVANHGQKEKYRHEIIGVNSRLDTIQAAILRVKLGYFDSYIQRRKVVAEYYDKHLASTEFLKLPQGVTYSSHTYHQYTVVTRGVDRDRLKKYLANLGIPTMIYYPIPLHHQIPYRSNASFPVAEELSRTVLSLPIHTEMDEDQLSYICSSINDFE